MWLKITEVRGYTSRYHTDKYESAYIYLTDYKYKKLQQQNGDVSFRLENYLPYIAIINNVPKKLLCGITFESYSKVTESMAKEITKVLDEYNLCIDEYGRWCFVDYEKICFNADGRKLSYKQFVNEFCLPKNLVFKEVLDNGYSYIGSEPFRGGNKEYADAAIKVTEKIGFLWFNWRYGFRLDSDFAIHVTYGKNEHYSEISNT